MLRSAIRLTSFKRTFASIQKKPVQLQNSSKFSPALGFLPPHPPIPTYRVMDTSGHIIDAQNDPQLPREECEKIYKHMVTLNVMDVILFDAQRQGRISFYMTNYGEEATHFGAASALSADDVVFGQYREAGVLLYRGFTLDEFMNQCYSNDADFGKGRQMPVHYGCARLNFQTISSPLGTQLPQAAGAAFAYKRTNAKNVAMCYFGEGAASEGDFHYALNFAATIGTPTIFLCRNNGYAISTPSHEQYSGDGIASRGWGYGIKTIRVDGNDVFAMYNAVKMSREYATEHYKPVLIEAMTYRVGHHSTSDDSSAYRNKKEADDRGVNDNPVTRLRKYMESKSWWSEQQETGWKTQTRSELLAAFNRAEQRKKPPIKDLFTDVYDTVPPHLKHQEKEMNAVINKYKDQYPLSSHSE